MLKDRDYYRQMAREARVFARQPGTRQDVSDAWLKTARHYEQLAMVADREMFISAPLQFAARVELPLGHPFVL